MLLLAVKFVILIRMLLLLLLCLLKGTAGLRGGHTHERRFESEQPIVD